MKCLAKHADDRWDTAHDVAGELRWLASDSGATGVVRPSATGAWPRVAFWMIGTLLAGAGLGFLLWPLAPRAQPSPRTSMRLAIALPPEMPLAPAGLVSPSHDRPALALSPDGTRLAYVTLLGGETRLCVRDMQTGKVSALDHTAAAHTPIFSPDGAWIGFFADNKLKKIPVGGGETTTLAEAPSPWGASWAPDGRIYFNRYEGEGVFSVGAQGGAPVETVLAGGSGTGLMPEFTDAGPGLFVAGVRYIDLRGASPVSRRVISGNRARYVSSGHLIYNSGSASMAVPFDASTMAPAGDSVTLVEDLRTANYGVAQFTVSREGTLVYVSGSPQGLTSFVLVDRRGSAERLELPEAEYGAYSLSPDGKNLAYALDGEIHVWSRERRTSVRLSPRTTAGTAALNNYPRWAPDGQTVLYSSTRAGAGARLLAAPVDGRPPVELWADKDVPWLYPMGFSPDGSVLSAFRSGRDSSFDLYLLPVSASGGSLAAAGKPEIFLGERFGECLGQISPDGRWMLFSSDQGGTYEIWATTYPKAGPRYRVSSGREAMWNPAVPGEVVVVDGRAVYAVDVTRGPAHPGNRQFLFDGPYPDTIGFGYDMTPDGRFLMLQNEDILKPATTLTVVTNFFDELRRQAPRRR